MPSALLHPLASNIASEGTLGYISHLISIALAFSLITFLTIVFGELVPKSLALQFPESVSRWTAGPLIFFARVFTPFIMLLNGAANLLLRFMHLAGLSPGASPVFLVQPTLAAAITTALRRRADEGGSWHAEVSLARVAHELLGAPRIHRGRHGVRITQRL